MVEDCTSASCFLLLLCSAQTHSSHQTQNGLGGSSGLSLLHCRLTTCSVMAGGNVLPFVCLLLSASASTACSARLRGFRKLGWIKAEQRIPSPIRSRQLAYATSDMCRIGSLLSG